MKHTKIVCTIGPATEDKVRLSALVGAGMDVARLNFSHGTHAWHHHRIQFLREIEADQKRPIAVLQDLCGPKLRISEVPKEGIELLIGRNCLLSTEPYIFEDGLPRIPIPIPGLIAALSKGDVVYMDDAQIELEVVDRRDDGVLCIVRHGGILLVAETTNGETRIAAIVEESKARGWIASGHTVAIATGTTVGTAGGTTGFRLETV